MIILKLPDGCISQLDNDDYYSVYDIIAGYLEPDISKISPENHQIAADAEGWAELACVGDFYETNSLPGLTISIT